MVATERVWQEHAGASVLGPDSHMLIERWEAEALSSIPAARNVPRTLLTGWLPPFLHALSAALGSEADEEHSSYQLLACRHGEERLQAGWRLSDTVREFQILRQVILEHVSVLAPCVLDLPTQALLHGALDDAIAASAVMFSQHQDLKLRDENQRKNEFLAVLGHELRNPLAAAVNAARLIRVNLRDNPAAEQAQRVLARQLDHISRLMDDLLEISHIARGRVELSQEPLDLESAVQRAVQATRPLLESRGHQLDILLPSAPIVVSADSTRLHQILTNLLTNAFKYTDPRGHVALAADVDGTYVVLRVRDNGIGIPQDQLSLIFEPFTQVDGALKYSQQGLGIGLALVRRLVELHGGTVEVYSMGMGEGSEFVVRLPLAQAGSTPRTQDSDAAIAIVSPSSSSSYGCCILVVDDNNESADMLAALLTLDGHRVHVAHDGEAALEQAPQLRPDVLLLDLQLPKVDGFEVARRLRGQPGLEGTMIVALTGYAEAVTRRGSRKPIFDHYFTKPVDYAALQKLLARVAQRHPSFPV